MKKRMISIALAMFFTVGTAGVSLAASEEVECKVTSVADASVVLDCGDNAAKLKEGKKFKISPPGKKLKVTAVDDKSVTVDAGDKAGEMKVDDTVTVKIAGKAGVEGC